MEPHSTFAGVLLLAVRQQLSVIAIAQALVVAMITATVTAYATVTKVDARMTELIQDVRDIKGDHSVIRERLTRVETIVQQPPKESWRDYKPNKPSPQGRQ